MSFPKKIRLSIFIILIPIYPLIFYLLSALILGIIPANVSQLPLQDGILIFVESNGVHTDIIVPVKTSMIDWTNHIFPEDFKTNSRPFRYISFGWGDKKFYLETPRWADLKAGVAFSAAFLPTDAAIHVSYLTVRPSGSLTREIFINEKQYAFLIQYIKDSFKKDENDNYIRIPCCNYAGENDNFYEAAGHFHLFYTCNSWTNEALKGMGLRTALWAPFDKAILYHLKR